MKRSPLISPIALPADPPDEPEPPTAAPMLTLKEPEAEIALPPEPPPPPILLIATAGECCSRVVIEDPLKVADAVFPVPPALPDPPTEGEFAAIPALTLRLAPPEPPPPPMLETSIPGD